MFEAYLLDRGTVRAIESGFSISSKSGSGSRVLMTKNWRRKKIQQKFCIIFFMKDFNLLTSKLQESLQPSKENIQHYKKWNLLTFFYIYGSFLPSRIRIRIQGPHWIRNQSGSGSRGIAHVLMTSLPVCVQARRYELGILYCGWRWARQRTNRTCSRALRRPREPSSQGVYR